MKFVIPLLFVARFLIVDGNTNVTTASKLDAALNSSDTLERHLSKNPHCCRTETICGGLENGRQGKGKGQGRSKEKSKEKCDTRCIDFCSSTPTPPPTIRPLPPPTPTTPPTPHDECCKTQIICTPVNSYYYDYMVKLKGKGKGKGKEKNMMSMGRGSASNCVAICIEYCSLPVPKTIQPTPFTSHPPPISASPTNAAQYVKQSPLKPPTPFPGCCEYEEVCYFDPPNDQDDEDDCYHCESVCVRFCGPPLWKQPTVPSSTLSPTSMPQTYSATPYPTPSPFVTERPSTPGCCVYKEVCYYGRQTGKSEMSGSKSGMMASKSGKMGFYFDDEYGYDKYGGEGHYCETICSQPCDLSPQPIPPSVPFPTSQSQPYQTQNPSPYPTSPPSQNEKASAPNTASCCEYKEICYDEQEKGKAGMIGSSKSGMMDAKSGTTSGYSFYDDDYDGSGGGFNRCEMVCVRLCDSSPPGPTVEDNCCEYQKTCYYKGPIGKGFMMRGKSGMAGKSGMSGDYPNDDVYYYDTEDDFDHCEIVCVRACDLSSPTPTPISPSVNAPTAQPKPSPSVVEKPSDPFVAYCCEYKRVCYYDGQAGKSGMMNGKSGSMPDVDMMVDYSKHDYVFDDDYHYYVGDRDGYFCETVCVQPCDPSHSDFAPISPPAQTPNTPSLGEDPSSTCCEYKEICFYDNGKAGKSGMMGGKSGMTAGNNYSEEDDDYYFYDPDDDCNDLSHCETVCVRPCDPTTPSPSMGPTPSPTSPPSPAEEPHLLAPPITCCEYQEICYYEGQIGKPGMMRGKSGTMMSGKSGMMMGLYNSNNGFRPGDDHYYYYYDDDGGFFCETLCTRHCDNPSPNGIAATTERPSSSPTEKPVSPITQSTCCEHKEICYYEGGTTVGKSGKGGMMMSMGKSHNDFDDGSYDDEDGYFCETQCIRYCGGDPSPPKPTSMSPSSPVASPPTSKPQPGSSTTINPKPPPTLVYMPSPAPLIPSCCEYEEICHDERQVAGKSGSTMMSGGKSGSTMMSGNSGSMAMNANNEYDDGYYYYNNDDDGYSCEILCVRQCADDDNPSPSKPTSKPSSKPFLPPIAPPTPEPHLGTTTTFQPAPLIPNCCEYQEICYDEERAVGKSGSMMMGGGKSGMMMSSRKIGSMRMGSDNNDYDDGYYYYYYDYDDDSYFCETLCVRKCDDNDDDPVSPSKPTSMPSSPATLPPTTPPTSEPQLGTTTTYPIVPRMPNCCEYQEICYDEQRASGKSGKSIMMGGGKSGGSMMMGSGKSGRMMMSSGGYYYMYDDDYYSNVDDGYYYYSDDDNYNCEIVCVRQCTDPSPPSNDYHPIPPTSGAPIPGPLPTAPRTTFAPSLSHRPSGPPAATSPVSCCEFKEVCYYNGQQQMGGKSGMMMRIGKSSGMMVGGGKGSGMGYDENGYYYDDDYYYYNYDDNNRDIDSYNNQDYCETVCVRPCDDTDNAPTFLTFLTGRPSSPLSPSPSTPPTSQTTTQTPTSVTAGVAQKPEDDCCEYEEICYYYYSKGKSSSLGKSSGMMGKSSSSGSTDAVEGYSCEKVCVRTCKEESSKTKTKTTKATVSPPSLVPWPSPEPATRAQNPPASKEEEEEEEEEEGCCEYEEICRYSKRGKQSDNGGKMGKKDGLLRGKDGEGKGGKGAGEDDNSYIVDDTVDVDEYPDYTDCKLVCVRPCDSSSSPSKQKQHRPSGAPSLSPSLLSLPRPPPPSVSPKISSDCCDYKEVCRYEDKQEEEEKYGGRDLKSRSKPTSASSYYYRCEWVCVTDCTSSYGGDDSHDDEEEDDTAATIIGFNPAKNVEEAIEEFCCDFEKVCNERKECYYECVKRCSW